MRTTVNKDMAVGMVFAVFSAFVFWQISCFDAVPTDFWGLAPNVIPLVLATLMLGLSLAVFAKGLTKVRRHAPTGWEAIPKERVARASQFALLLLVTLVLLRVIGFFPALSVFALVAPFLFNYRKMRATLVTAVILITFTYFVFAVALNVYFPKGLIESLGE